MTLCADGAYGERETISPHHTELSLVPSEPAPAQSICDFPLARSLCLPFTYSAIGWGEQISGFCIHDDVNPHPELGARKQPIG